MQTAVSGATLLDPEVVENPYSFYRMLHREHVWRVPGTDIYLVGSFPALDEAVRRTEDFSSNMTHLIYRGEDNIPARFAFGGETGIQVLATADPPLHGIHKRAIFPDLMSKRMMALEPEIREIASLHIDRCLAMGEADFMHEIGGMVPITVIASLIGFTDPDHRALLQAAYDSTTMLAMTMTFDQFMSFVARSDDIGDWILQQMAAASPGDQNILGTISRAIADGTLSEAEGRVFLHTMLSAGGESTSSLLGNGVRMLAENPDLQERLRQDPALIPRFVDEALRLESPFRHHLRSVPRDTELCGIQIPAGSSVLMMWGAANRDEREYPDAERIDLDRKRGQMAFGRGIHTCIGAPLARLEARITFEQLLSRTSSFSITKGKTPKWENSLMVRRHERLPVTFQA